VRLRDLRFDYLPLSVSAPPPRRSPLSASVIIDRNGKVALMRMGNREEKPKD